MLSRRLDGLRDPPPFGCDLVEGFDPISREHGSHEPRFGIDCDADVVCSS